jgi:hypothetical protein
MENRVEVAAHLGNMGAVAAAEGAEQVDAHGWAVLMRWTASIFLHFLGKSAQKTLW